MKLAIYARVSTEIQSLEPQLLELRAHAANRGLKVAHEITDVISGAKASREGLDRLMAMVEAREIDAIMVVKIDRIARSLTNFVRVCALLTENKVALIIPGQGIDTSNANPCGEMQLGILAVIAQFERSLIQERTKAGLAVARAKGKVLGRPSPNLVPASERAALILAWRKTGDGYAALADLLGGVSTATAWKLDRALVVPPTPTPASAPVPSVELGD